uniref:NADH-ubiquinone oxidoreductase chain 3 n=1 Tax=Platynereis cf. australis PA-2020 TaxID=2759233 RepID=A0A7G9UJ06_9ANNE|nr:NADH dehydrogenase subunit 3 [Platynereis cf. australis PA-2020]QNN93074.1 NADH dehydrogenase subunit 3 [Platynereis cf. australis PA-2020]QNN93087.1 NADH dehydrogenase subunit 3 [Platynereis cf. australis PA-2020]QNN93100.1 NADH dehydrogenase subunit 3 [Platynereis cf. australis PA-2020]
MNLIILNMVIASIFPIVIITATAMLNKSMQFNFEKSTPFECGFDPHNSARIPFSLRFFILAVLFLVFDIEIALLMPIPSTTFISPMVSLTVMLFCTVLLAGLYHEWNEGSLEWK